MAFRQVRQEVGGNQRAMPADLKSIGTCHVGAPDAPLSVLVLFKTPSGAEYFVEINNREDFEQCRLALRSAGQSIWPPLS